MPLPPNLTRRDFMNGAAIGVAGLALGAGCGKAPAASYPPALLGLRGAHAGAFEAAHALAWEGRHWDRPTAQTDETYDLVVIGAGLSGLAAACLFRERFNDARILILDNHDDFGGHAKRNEFEVDGKPLIGYGGSQSIDSPARYSHGAKRLLSALGVETKRFYDYFDREFYSRRGLQAGLYLDKEHWGEHSLSPMPVSFWSEEPADDVLADTITRSPLPVDAKQALRTLTTATFFNDKRAEEKIALLRKGSYEDFLRGEASAPESLILLLRRIPHGIWGVGWDALSALEAARWGMPGTQGLGLPDAALADPHQSDEPYIFHFPDGNASLARLLVRRLIPEAVSGSTMEDIVGARVDYRKLDRDGSSVRLRLNATAVDLRHTPEKDAVDVLYISGGAAKRLSARHAIMAGHLAMLPYMTPELSEAQQEAIRFFTKVPLVYVNVALRNWRAFDKAGYHRIYSPTAFYDSLALDFPVSLGDYHFAKTPDDPILLHLQHVPTEPGLPEKDQHRAGRRQLYALAFADFENAIVNELTGMVGAYGFDATRDIAAITVNRWPHGYAYEYNELYDPPEWSPANGPHLAARAQIGRISIANSDASALAYVNGAFDAAIRAVDEQAALG